MDKTMLQGLTVADLHKWAGRAYDRGKSSVRCVSQLSRIEDGTLVAWVFGTDRYASSIRYGGQGKFDYGCTCPYDGLGPCKHVVALLLTAARELERGKEIPLLGPDDDLYLEAFAEDDGAWMEKESDVDSGRPPARPRKGLSSQIEAMLAGKTRDELQALLVELALAFPEVLRRLRDTARLEGGRVDQLVRHLRKEIRRLTPDDIWRNAWKGEVNLPDYSHVEEQLEALLAKGHADAVFELGEELWKRGLRQVEECHDGGQTARTLASCLNVVLRALPQTSLTPPEQLLWRIEHEMDDAYNLLDEADVVLNDPRYTPEHWREVAAVLEARLNKLDVPEPGGHSAGYRREGMMNWLRNAYRCCGETKKIIPLLEREAERCRSYNLLVETLLEAGEPEQARQWCIRGYQGTIENLPGLACGLQARLRELAEARGRLDLAAAYRAEDFFEFPSEKGFRELQRAAEKINAWPVVREGILAYLQTGVRPGPDGMGKKAWPLPETEVSRPKSRDKFGRERFPNREMLIEIALLEKRHDDAVSTYQELSKTKRWGWRIDERLAEAVAISHPDVALHIWQSIAEGLIGQVTLRGYLEAAGYLRQMHKVYEKAGRVAEWKTLLMRLRTQHKAKRRLMGVLDDLEGNRKLIG